MVSLAGDGMDSGWAFLSRSCGRLVVVRVSHASPPQARVISFGSTVWTVPEHGACRRHWGAKALAPRPTKQRHCSSGWCPAPGGRRVSFRSEGGSWAAG